MLTLDEAPPRVVPARRRPHAVVIGSGFGGLAAAVRPGGRVSIPGVYGGMSDKFPLGEASGETTADVENLSKLFEASGPKAPAAAVTS